MRRESFGAIIFSESPGFTAFVDNQYADRLGISQKKNLNSKILSAPMDVHFSLTNQCNMNCKGCYSVMPNEPKSELNFELAKRIIDNLVKMDIFTISFGGGEPLMYSKLFELASYARENNILPNITTNASLISNDNVNKLKVFGNVHLSIHSLSDIAIIQNAVKLLRKENISLGINLLVTKETINDLEYIIKCVKKMKMPKVLFLKYKTTKKNSLIDNMNLTVEQECSLYPLITKLCTKHHILPMIDCSLFPTIAIHKVSPKVLKYHDLNGCQGGNMYIAIDQLGRYKPCSFWEETFGEALTLTSDEWLNSKKLNAFRSMCKNESCYLCNYSELCNYGCRMFEKQLCQYPLVPSS